MIRKIVTVGTYGWAGDVIDALEREGYKVTQSARVLLYRGRCVFARETGEVGFVFLSYADLGRPHGCSYQEVCELGIAAGYELCEPSDAAELRLSYPDQPHNEVLVIAMKAIGWSDSPWIFRVRDNGNDKGADWRWLDACIGAPMSIWTHEKDVKFVFRVPHNLIAALDLF
jgi:hypothetical protein